MPKVNPLVSKMCKTQKKYGNGIVTVRQIEHSHQDRGDILLITCIAAEKAVVFLLFTLLYKLLFTAKACLTLTWCRQIYHFTKPMGDKAVCSAGKAPGSGEL